MLRFSSIHFISYLLLLCFVGLLSNIALTSNAIAQNSINYLVVYEGACKYKIDRMFENCDQKVVQTFLNNGRSLFSFTSDNYMFTLVGGRDRQPNLENYYVSLDKLIIDKGIKSGAPIKKIDPNMEGECHLNMNRDATKIYFLKCDIYNRSKRTVINFVLDKVKKVNRLGAN